jgi:hypothetical protein
MRRRIAGVVAALGMAGATLAVAAGGAQAAPAPASPIACATNWGTNAKHQGPAGTVRTALLDVRVGQHACFDRLVIDLGPGPRPPYQVQYVKRIIADGSGKVLKVRGHAKILISVHGPAARGYHPNAVNLADVSGFPAFRQVRGAGSFERVTSIGLGVAAKAPFRVILLGSASAGWRLVVDVRS